MRVSAAIFALACAAACDGPAPLDAGVDAGDAGRTRDAGTDAGPLCSLACESGDTCCVESDGSEVCATLRNDPRHCGTCTIDCEATHRGDGCLAMQCTCGSSLLGCSGGRNSYCCPPRGIGGDRYCADLDRQPSDCGECGAACDARVSDRCSGGVCVCGDQRAPCLGTPESRCCADSEVDVGCVDTTTDRFHCGECNRLCSSFERCEGGTCTEGTACADGCELFEICCNGSCCTRDRCIGGVCGGAPVDAGPIDAGPIDAGPIDAGPFDAGP